jgi:hypothetical protein
MGMGWSILEMAMSFDHQFPTENFSAGTYSVIIVLYGIQGIDID